MAYIKYAGESGYYVTYKVIDDAHYQRAQHVETNSGQVPKWPEPLNRAQTLGSTFVCYKASALQSNGQFDWSDEHKYADKEKLPSNQNITVYVRELLPADHQIQYVTDRWITLILPFEIADVNTYFGYADAEQTVPAVRAKELTGVQVTGNKYELQFEHVDYIHKDRPYMFKADHVMAGKYFTEYHTQEAPSDEEEAELLEREHLTVNCEHQGTKVEMRGTFNGRTLTYDPDVTQFFLGYKTNDPDETPKFYRVSTARDVQIQPFRCWFTISDITGEQVPSNKVSMTFTNEKTGIKTVIQNDGTEMPEGNIYSVDGQLVRRNATSTEGLAKGVYIVRGKKVVVR